MDTVNLHDKAVLIGQPTSISNGGVQPAIP